MMLITRRSLVAGMASSALVAPAFGQHGADAYPDRTIKILCASPPGGGTDASARGIGRGLQKLWNQPVVIENRTGGSNNIAAEAVSKSEPDGYTLLATTGNVMLVNAALFKNLSYDPAALEPVAILGNALTVLVTRKDFPAKTVPELVAYAKANPRKVNYGTTGSGTSVHLAMELLQIRAGIELVQVPYRGMAPAYNDLVGGHLDIMFVDYGGTLALHETGALRIIATSEKHRLKGIPDVPTLAESGLPDVRTSIFWALMAPPKTPAAIRAKLNNTIRDIQDGPEFVALLEGLKAEPVKFDTREMGDYLKSESKLWTDVIRTANVPTE
jgi:tripartite-type tricarboxylate transporter receptor subunit TctC